MKNVFILSDINGKFRVVEAFERKQSFYHSDGDILSEFESKKIAEIFCNELDFIIINNK